MNIAATVSAPPGTFNENVLRSWRWLTAVAVSAALLLAAAPAGATSATSAAEGEIQRVVVRASAATVEGLRDAVLRAGGTVRRELPIINGFAADVPAGTVKSIDAVAGVDVTPDARLQPHSSAASIATLGYDSNTTGSLSAITRIIGAQDLWAQGYTGRGVDIALIDTGIAPVPGLDGPGKVVHGPDLSFDSQNPDLVNNDSYGHGTHMASIIAGRDEGTSRSALGCLTCLNSSGFSDTTKFVGVAPEARLVNVKVGATDGAVDVSQVIAALDWVVQYGKTGGLNIRVLNLSYGTDASQDYVLDPLSYAAGVAWRKGVVVVVSGGNDGTMNAELANPAYNPRLLAVGADDPMGTMERSDDTVPAFASRSTTRRNVDIIAPGVSVLGLKSPGSFSDAHYPNATVGTRFMKGSGTSQSAAVVSGAVALILERYPNATPDQVKELLRNTAYMLKTTSKPDQGRGLIDLSRAMQRSLPNSTQTVVQSTGLGTLDGARGSYRLFDGDVELRGEIDIFGKPWNASRWSADSWNATAWTGGEWNASRWSGDTWAASRWSSAEWTSDSWAASRWSASRWSGMVWDASRWSGTGWQASRWSASRWSASRWSEFAWSSAGWE